VTRDVEFNEAIVVGGGCYGTFYARQLAEAKSRGRVRYQRILVVDRDPACQMVQELGESTDRELVVDDWGAFFDRYLGSLDLEPSTRLAAESPGHSSAEPPNRPTVEPPDSGAEPPSLIVPSPLMPHLMYQWLLRRAQRRWPGRTIETRSLSQGPGTPYDVLAPDRTRYVSFADWICPTHCTEPLRCPVIRGPRTWDMADAAAHLVGRLNSVAPTAGPVLFECRHRVFGVGAFTVDEVLSGDRLVAEAGRTGSAVNILVGTVSACHGALNLLHLGAG